jgi:parallel beta-helix repeat protein
MNIKAPAQKISAALFVSLAVFSITSTGWTATYYVATTGNDNNPGTTSQPWRTIKKATNTVVAGDTVIVNPGTYNERINVSRSGTSDSSRITFSASGTVNTYGFYVTGNYVTINGFTATSQVCGSSQDSVGIYVVGNSCIVENNYTYYSPRGGIRLDPASANCTVINNRVHRNGMVGIDIRGTNHLIENNDIWGSVAYHTPTGCTGDADGIRFWGSGHTIKGNHIHDISLTDPGNVGYSPHIDCFQTWIEAGRQTATNIVFEGNICENRNLMMYSGMIHGSSYLTFKNNIFIGYAGLNVNPSNGPNDHLTFVNNTCIGDTSILNCTVGSDCWPSGIGLEDVSFATVKNNIFYNLLYRAYSIKGTTTGMDAGFNLIYRSDGKTPQGPQYPNDLWGVDPKFANPAQKDFHLQSTSPAINAGDTVSTVTNDCGDNPRPQGAGFDIGAFEFSVRPSPPKNFKQLN